MGLIVFVEAWTFKACSTPGRVIGPSIEGPWVIKPSIEGPFMETVSQMEIVGRSRARHRYTV